MIYKKMFEIPFNNKKIAIFIDEFNRRTFLEVDSEGRYHYPLLEDFLVLNEVYNNRDPYVNYMIERYTFPEKVRMATAGALSVAILTSSLMIETKKVIAKIDNDKLVISIEEQDKESIPTVNIYYPQDLDKVLGYTSITIEEIEYAINNNGSLPNNYKEIATDIIHAINNNYPEIDLRIFYERIKSLNVNQISSEEIQEKYNQAAVGANNHSAINTINAPADASRGLIAHELCHCLNYIYQEINGKRVVKSTGQGHALDEAQTCEIASLVSDAGAYTKERALLRYFRTCVPFSMADGSNTGMWYLKELLKEKYPNLDINFIFNTIDSIQETSITFGVNIPLDANKNFLDEIFMMCKENVKDIKGDIYEPFINFAKILDFVQDKELYFSYLEEYNTFLKECGYTNIIERDQIDEYISKFEDMKGFLIGVEGEAYPYFDISNEEGVLETKIIDETGNLVTPPFVGAFNCNYMFNVSLKYQLVKNYMETKSEVLTQDFWQNFIIVEKITDSTKLAVPILINQQFIDKTCSNKLMIAFGQNKSCEIAFCIRKENDILYKSSNEILNMTKFTRLSNYIKYSYNSKIELNNYLNENYLKSWIGEGYFFDNIYVIDETLVFKPKYKVYVAKDGKSYPVDVDSFITASDYVETVTSSDPLGEVYVTYRTLIEKYNLIEDETTNYLFTESSLKEILENYINDKGIDVIR